MLRRSLIVSALFFVTLLSCGPNPNDPCKRALKRLVDECNYSISGLDSLNTNCTGQAACVAKCLDESPCEDIAANDGEFATCVKACNKK